MSASQVDRPKLKRIRLPRIGRGSAGLRMTGREFDAIDRYDDSYNYELFGGTLVVNPIPLEAEADPNDALGFYLRLYQHQRPEGTLDLTLPERYVNLTDLDRRRADRLIWAGLGRLPDPSIDKPTIVVEFVSRARRDWLRDYHTKRDEYLAFGIKEYWVIDRFRRTMTVFRSADPGPSEQVITEAGTYVTLLLPGFELPLVRLLEVADRWAKSHSSRKRPKGRGNS
jgi:Uma2 family endonuclease